MTTAVFELLRNAMNERYGGSVTKLADALNVPVQSASKWVLEDERKRTIPGPASCEKIAEGLGLDPDYVLQVAGHRKARPGQIEPDDWTMTSRTWRSSARKYITAIGSRRKRPRHSND